MKQISGDLWDYFEIPNHVICITTNGDVTANGLAVMGRGCAWEAAVRIPHIAKLIALHLRDNGNVPKMFLCGVLTFPVKHHWHQKADMELIRSSAEWLARWAKLNPAITYVLPRPGCGNGRLSWPAVHETINPILPDNVSVIDHG
jgi:hypothetical protein